PQFIHPSRLDDAELVDTVKQMAIDVGRDAFIRQQKAIMSREGARPLLPSIRRPTLVLVGRHDVLTPVELAQELSEGIAGSRLVIVEDSGHLPTLERPEAVNAAMRQWLSEP